MIVFYVLKEIDRLRKLYNDLKSKVDIPVFWLNQSKLITESHLQLRNKELFINGSIKTTDESTPLIIENVKTWFIAQYPCIPQEWLPYENALDKNYAQQEWNATISAMLLTQRNSKFINPLWAKYDFNTEIEQLLIMQKFGFKTLEMILTNNTECTLQYFDLWKRQALYKSVRKGYENAAIMKPSDLGRLEKLHLSPAIFQKAYTGEDITVCLINKDFYAIKYDNKNQDEPYKETNLPETIKEKLIDLSKHLNTPWLVSHFLYDKADSEYYGYGLNIYPDFEYSYELFGEPFIDMLHNYLIKEYHK